MELWKDFRYPITCQRECEYRADCSGWSWGGQYAEKPYSCFLSFEIEFSEENLVISEFFISGRKECDSDQLEHAPGVENIPGTCLYKSEIAGYAIGNSFDDFEELKLGMLEPPLTKMVFWRYTCAAPCLGTEAVPGRNGHVTSFMAKYDGARSGFRGYPLLGGTKTAMRTFFNFTSAAGGFLEENDRLALERVRKVEVDISAPPWGAVSMVKLTTTATENNEENFHYVGFIKWRHSGFLALNPPSGFPDLKWHVRAFHGYVDKAGYINGIGKSIKKGKILKDGKF